MNTRYAGKLRQVYGKAAGSTRLQGGSGKVTARPQGSCKQGYRKGMGGICTGKLQQVYRKATEGIREGGYTGRLREATASIREGYRKYMGRLEEVYGKATGNIRESYTGGIRGGYGK